MGYIPPMDMRERSGEFAKRVRHCARQLRIDSVQIVGRITGTVAQRLACHTSKTYTSLITRDQHHVDEVITFEYNVEQQLSQNSTTSPQHAGHMHSN
jgi:hypothetical protein